uniref:Uncharacterized protein n=1 Tax=Anopheles culicifacies TaxID=139723 RepID=A0A182LXU0_9DIPT
MVEEVILPADDKVPATDTATTLTNEPVADPLLLMRAFEQGNAATGTGELVIEGDPSSADVLSFPEVQQLLNELIKNEEFDAKRLTKKDTVSSGGAQSTKSVEIDPQVSYSRVVRQ